MIPLSGKTLVYTSKHFCSTLKASNNITARGLYKILLRDCSKLPNEAQNYYKHKIRQGFIQHADEIDSERINQIITRSLEDSKWIIDKYTKKK